MHVREDRLRLLVAMARAAPEAQVGLLVAAFGPGALADDPPADVRSGSEQPLGLRGQRVAGRIAQHHPAFRSEEHTSEPPSLMRNSYAVFCLNKKNIANHITVTKHIYHP